MLKITQWNRRKLMQVAGAVCLASAGAAAMAQADYPARTIKVVVPYSAGGNTDAITRSVMRDLATRLGQPVVVENKPGANSILGTDLVAKAAPDGYTLLVTIGAYANNQSLYKSLPYAPTDLVPVSLLTRTSLVLVSSDPQVRTVEDLIRKGNQPGATVTFASSGVGSAAHLLGERQALPLDLPGDFLTGDFLTGDVLRLNAQSCFRLHHAPRFEQPPAPSQPESGRWRRFPYALEPSGTRRSHCAIRAGFLVQDLGSTSACAD